MHRFFGWLTRQLLWLSLHILWRVAGALLGYSLSALRWLAPKTLTGAVQLTETVLVRLDRNAFGANVNNLWPGMAISVSGWALAAAGAYLLLSQLLSLRNASLFGIAAAAGGLLGAHAFLRVRSRLGTPAGMHGDGLHLGNAHRDSAGMSPVEPVVLSRQQRQGAQLVIGQPRVGKSRAMAGWALEDIRAGRGVGFFDPHEDGFWLVARHLAILAENDHELAERVVIVNPLDPDWVVGINPLELLEGVPAVRLAAFFKDLALKIWGLDSTVAPRMSWLMTHTFMALAELELTLAELPLFLRDHEWRAAMLKRVQNREVLEYFLKEFPQDPRLQQEWMQSTINKMGEFILDDDVRCILGQTNSTVNLREVLDGEKVLLVNLSKGRLGRENSHLLGALLVGAVQQAALARADMDKEARADFFLYLDEFQNFITDDIRAIPTEMPKYGLRLIIAHQHLSQLTPDLMHSVLNTHGTLTCFRVGYEDARQLAPEIFSLDHELAFRTRWRLRRVGSIPLYWPERHLKSPREAWEPFVRELVNLGRREFWVKQRDSHRPVKQRTQEVPDVDCAPEILERLLTLSGVRYARRKREVVLELEERADRLQSLAAAIPPQHSWS